MDWLRVLPAVSPSLGRRPPTQTSIFSKPGSFSSVWPLIIPPLTFLPLLLLAYLRRADVSPSPRWDYGGVSHKSKERARRVFSSFFGIRRPHPTPPTRHPHHPTPLLTSSSLQVPPSHPVLPRSCAVVTNPKETHCGRVRACVCVFASEGPQRESPAADVTNVI